MPQRPAAQNGLWRGAHAAGTLLTGRCCKAACAHGALCGRASAILSGLVA